MATSVWMLTSVFNIQVAALNPLIWTSGVVTSALNIGVSLPNRTGGYGHVNISLGKKFVQLANWVYMYVQYHSYCAIYIYNVLLNTEKLRD